MRGDLSTPTDQGGQTEAERNHHPTPSDRHIDHPGTESVEHGLLDRGERRSAERTEGGDDGQRRRGRAEDDEEEVTHTDSGEPPPAPDGMRRGGTDRLCGWTTDPAKRAAPEKARSGPARVRTSLVEAGAGPSRCNRSPRTSARIGDWSHRRGGAPLAYRRARGA